MAKKDIKVKRGKKGKKKGYAIAAFITALFTWIPMLNFVLSLLAIYLGVVALLKIKKDKRHYGGVVLAIIAIIIGVFVAVMSFTWLFCPTCVLGENATSLNVSRGLFQ